MTMRLWALPAFLMLIGTSSPTIRPLPDEATAHFAARVLGQPEDRLQVLDSRWNGRRAIFADYQLAHDRGGYEEHTREIFVLLQRDDDVWDRIRINSVGEEGGDAQVAAIGFAQADGDEDKELILLLKWPQVHYNYGGDLYKVEIYDAPDIGQSQLTYLARVSGLFGSISCDCSYRDGRPDTDAPFSTIAAIKKKLSQSGY